MVRLLQLYKSIVHGVAFIPLLVALALLILGLFLTLSPAVQSFDPFVSSRGYFEVRTPETARAVLSSLLTGIISLTVFGFSMMMVVVNQAASNYSPKVVETLTSQRSNQYILGVDLGTIIFTLIVMMHIDNNEADGGVPRLAIFVNMVLAIYCLLLFVKFINNISNSVRINNIIEMIYRKTKRSIRRSESRGWQPSDIQTDQWPVYAAGHAGYYQAVRLKRMIRTLQKLDAVVKVIPLPGSYYTVNEPLFAINKELDDEAAEKIRADFVTYPGETISENAFYGFRQLREIAVKGLSPGINDPGVAILCVDYLSELLSLQVGRTNAYHLKDVDGKPRIIVGDIDFRSLLESSFLPIKGYAKRDYTVLASLLHAAYQISINDPHGTEQAVLSEFALSVIQEADESIRDRVERRVLNERVSQLKKTRYFELPFLNSPAP